VFIVGGFEEAKDPAAAPVRRSRIPVAEFGAAISLGSKETMESDEVECLLANMIYKVRLIFFSRIKDLRLPSEVPLIVRHFVP
jgi:hypothetical protein